MNEPVSIPRSDWGPGPWQEEPDRVEFKAYGFPCLMVRNAEVTGSWCGYVALSPGHPYFEKPYCDVDVNVHGGLTYADHCCGDICHVPKKGETDNVWWLGFDCAHAFDCSPRLYAYTNAVFGKPPAFLGQGHYWTCQEVREEVESLAKQFSQVTSDRQTARLINSPNRP